MLHIMGSYLCNWLTFDPLGEVLDRHNKVFHLPYCQKERTQDVYSPSMERPQAVNQLQLFGWCVMPISLLLTLLTVLCILLEYMALNERGGELFKKDFRKLLSLERKYFKKTLIKN